jgi:O-antigen ligase
MFAAILSAPQTLVARLVDMAILAAFCSILLGAAQLASGSERLYPWETTSLGAITGFFANRNHLASLLLVSLPFAVILGANSLRRRDANTLPLWFAAFFTGLVVIALAAIRSRTGILLFAPVITVSLLAAWFASGRERPAAALLAVVSVTAAALTVALAVALPPILARFDTVESPELRFERWPIVAQAAETYLPLGSGLGSFDAVFRSVEPLDQLDGSFFNQAHNDYLETWLEAGWPGVGLIIAFLIWYGRRTWTAWRAPPSRDRHLQRAASIAVGVLILHSAVDYPLRTLTLAVFMALCCGVLELASRPDRISTRTRIPI